jgi:hypothetical protein
MNKAVGAPMASYSPIRWILEDLVYTTLMF